MIRPENNGKEIGTTWRYLLRSTTHPGFGSGSPFIVVPESILESLTHLLMISTERLLATTYAWELARLYAPARPHAEHLLGHRKGKLPLRFRSYRQMNGCAKKYDAK